MGRSNAQPQHSPIPKDILNLKWFHPEELKDLDDDHLDVALQSVQRFVQPESINFVVEVALERRGCIEFLLSSLSEDKFTLVWNWVNKRFPHDLDSYAARPLYARLLSTVSLSLFFFQYPDRDDRPPDLDSSHQYVALSSSVLKVIPDLIQSSFPDIDGDSSDEEQDFPMVKRKQASQKAQKYAKRNRQMTKSVDVTPFRAFGLDVPTSSYEARKMALSILDKQKDVLLSYLETFRLPSLSDAFKRNYIPTTVPEALAIDEGALQANSSVRDIEVAEEVPAAYPQVQPMKAALYFDSVEGFGQWRILISGRADRNLRETRKKDASLFRITLKKIKELSNGHFSDDNQKRLNGTSIPVPIYEAKMTRDSRLVYQVDCVQDFDSRVSIRVFGIYTHAQMDKRLWDSMGYQLSRKGKEYQRRCTFRTNPIHKGDKVILPASFPAATLPDLKTLPDDLPVVNDQVLEEDHRLEKFVAFSQVSYSLRVPENSPHSWSILADQEAVHVFQVSPHEQEIIEHAYSCFVQGRSGTGKTTTMLFKMLGLENSWHQNRELRADRPRQLFVTSRRVFIKLLQSLVLESQTQSGISDLLERQRNREEAGLVDQDEALNWREDLPRKFSELQASHFPMFITFDKLSAMIEADMNNPRAQLAVSSEYMLQRRKSFISFDVFRHEYWAHFPQSLTKGLDVSLVFSEFMGVIKGSEMTLDSESHFLDYETYLNLSSRTQATFACKRKEIYALFEAYLRMKCDRREYDAADRTHSILRNITEGGLKGQKLDFLYVDEVQDNMLIDSKLLRAICRNPDGQFWAGDTAQTISVGSSFRFDDLKAFLHRNEERLKQQVTHMAAHQPKSFQLVTNFRSHGGIVRCAHSVIRLITKFWPYAIDILPEEKGIVDGIKPVFFSGWDQDKIRYESFLFGKAGHHVEFGAHQCILVRNDAAMEKLREQVGDVGLIMYQGLEFNDVLLYDFFDDSTVDVAQWRVILNAINRTRREKIPAPTFDENRHASVCAELKFLYVAITRARKNLWIVDRSETAEPMRVYWSSENLVQSCTPGTDVPQLAVSSSPEEWAKMARTLFSHKRYYQAMHSYERAGKTREKNVANAYHLREQARGIPVRNRPGDDERRNAYTKVAEAFLASGQEATITRERNEYYRIAAESFLVLEDHARAAQAFEKASKFTEAAQHYRHAGMFDETVSVIRNHGSAMDLQSRVSSLTLQNTFIFKGRTEVRVDLPFTLSSLEQVCRKASALFSSPEEELEFVRECDLDIAEVKILVARGQFFEAAELHIRENRLLDAVEVLLKDKTSEEAIRRASQSLLGALWNVLSFGVLPTELDNESRANLSRIMRLIEQLDLNALEERTQREFRMFRAIYKTDEVALMSLTRSFIQDENKPAALLCLDHVFRNLSQETLLTYSDNQVLLKTRGLCDYSGLVQEMLFVLEPWTKQSVQKLFSFTIQSQGRICLPRGTFLHDNFKRSYQHALNEDANVEVRAFYDLYRSVLRRRLREKLEAYCNMCQNIRVFSPCEQAIFGRGCDRNECQRQHEFDHAWFDKRLQFHLFQISILSSLRYFGLGEGQTNHRIRIWFERLYDVINPTHSAFGSSTNIALHANRQTSRTFDLLKTFWIWPRLHDLDPSWPNFLSTFLRLVDLGSFIDNKALVEHVNRTRSVQENPPPRFIRETNGSRYVITELIGFLHGKEYWSINAGAMFIQHILSNKLSIELMVLCRLLEFVVGSFVMASAYQKKGSLHGVTLPRSWILENVQNLHRVQNKHAHLHVAWEMVKPFQDLLERIYSGTDTDILFHQNKPLHAVHVRVRNLALARLCRIICLLGFNAGSTPLKDFILESITALRKKDTSRKFSSLYSSYVYANEWWQLAIAVTKSISSTPLDEMITLMHENKEAFRIFRGVRTVKFRTVDDIRRQLTSVAGPASTLNPAAAPFIPIQGRPQANGTETVTEVTADETNEDEDDPIEEAPEEDGESPEDADVAGVIESIGARVTEISEETLAKQHSAAKTLQFYYRRLLINRANRIANPGLGLLKARQNQFEAFARAAECIEWPEKSLYRPIFLGALPHLLVCLDYTRSIVMEEKAKVKRQRSSEKHQGIEQFMERQTHLTNLIKRIKSLQTSLEASSGLHKHRDLMQLEVHVGRVSSILDEVPRAKEELSFDMGMACAWKRYVKERQKPPKVEKPELNTADLDDVFIF
ncbi:hypothetical protein BGW80DRAFT_1322645 [Lactifluus volemus]|nr:hypothetical protein BGW80DRAFT_1322645 [Lactifluus volemus]